MFEYGETVLVRPVMHYFREDEDGDVLLPCRLWCEEVVSFLRTQNVSFVPFPGGLKQKKLNLGFAHGQIRVPRACFSSSTVVADTHPTYWVCDLIRYTYLDGITHDRLPILDNKP